MELHKAKKVVITTEAILANRIIDLLTEFGIKGYTVQGASGAGERGLRAGDESGGIYKNVRIEVLTNAALAQEIAAKLHEKYFNDYAGIVYLQDVEVLRPKKFLLT